MINVSNEWKAIVADATQDKTVPDFTAKATIILANGTTLPITQEDIVVGGLSITDSVSASNSFQIGTAFINENDILLNNIEHKFDDVDFTDAVVIPYVGLNKSTATEWLKKGTFTMDEATVSASIVSLISLDHMNKLDVPFSEVSISFPTNPLMLAQAICLHCGVVLFNSTFLNSNVTITRKPTDEALTCRSIIGWIAQMGGNFARCNVDGALELKWYDVPTLDNLNIISGGTFEKPSSDVINEGTFTAPSTDIISGGTFSDITKYHHLYSFGSQPTIGTDDVVITGVRVSAMGTDTDKGETVLFGSIGYVIEIADNPLIQEGMATTIANTVGGKIVGMRFRQAAVQTITDPSREAGDIGILSHKNNTYPVIFSNYHYQFGSNDTITSDAETPSKNSSGYSPTTKVTIEARKVAKQELTSYDLQMQVLTSLIAQSAGMYKTDVVQPSGGTIYYTHDKDTMVGSTTRWYMVGGALLEETNVNGTWMPVSGVDKQGNALYNIISARGINVDWLIGAVITGKNIISPFGTTGKIEFMNGVLNLVNTLAHKVMTIGTVVSDGAFGNTPYIGLDANINDFGIGTTANDYASFNTVYKYTPSEKCHYLYGDSVKFNGKKIISENCDVFSSSDYISAWAINYPSGSTKFAVSGSFPIGMDELANEGFFMVFKTSGRILIRFYEFIGNGQSFSRSLYPNAITGIYEWRTSWIPSQGAAGMTSTIDWLTGDNAVMHLTVTDGLITGLTVG